MIDRASLKQAIDKLASIGQSNSQRLFTWSVSEDDVSQCIEPFHIPGVGVVSPPLKPLDIAKLIKKYHPIGCLNQNSTGNTCCQVDGSLLTFQPCEGLAQKQNLLQDLTYNSLHKMLGISFENLLDINVESKPEKLVVCTSGESYKACFNLLSEPGKFGTLLLTIPLKMKKDCGKVVIHDGARKTQIDFKSNSCYSVAAIAGHCSNASKAFFTIESGPSEMTAVMVFHLVWKNYAVFGRNDVLSPTWFPEFIILANQIKTALNFWEVGEQTASRQHNQSKEDPHFLCLPLSGRYLAEIDISKLTAKDMIIFKCLTSIGFINVHCLSIEQTKMESKATGARLKNAKVPEATILSNSSLQFLKPIKFGRKIDDGLLDYPIEEATNLICDVSSYGWSKDSKTSSVSAIIIRPRNLSHILIPKSDIKEAKRKSEIFMERLASRLIYYSEKNLLENPFVRKSLLAELKQLIDHLCLQNNAPGASDSVAICLRCFFSRLFDTCYQLKAEDFAQQILKDILKRYNLKELFVCTCSRCSNYSDPVITFTKFICFTKGWELYPDVMRQLTNAMLADGSCSFISEIALNLLQNDNSYGARETFKIILEAVRNSLMKPEEFKKLFHVGLVPLALRLNEEDEPNEEVLTLLISGMKHLELSQLTELIEHLGGLLKDERLDCRCFMRLIGNIVLETRFQNFAPQQFLKIMDTYSSIGEHELRKSCWKSLCVQCTEMIDSKQNRTCLFCDILREEKSPRARKKFVADLKGIEEFNDAAKCSLEKLFNYAERFDVASTIEYLRFVLLIENDIQLSKTQIVERFSAFFSRLRPDIMENLMIQLFRSMYRAVMGKATTTNGIYRKLLDQIVNQGLDIILGMDMALLLFRSAWCGAFDLVKLFLCKLDAAIAATKLTSSSKLETIYDTLEWKFNGINVASSPNVTRETFNYLMFECLKLLECEKLDRITRCVEVFVMLATSERSFIDSTRGFITEQWQALIKSLTFRETVVIVARIFEREVSNEKPSLKKFPSVWKIFTGLCSSLLFKWQTTAANDAENLAKSNALNEARLVLLMQCYFWIDDEKKSAEFCLRLNEAHVARVELADVHRAIVRDKRTVDLAAGSMHATLAFNDLVDTRIKILNKRLTDSCVVSNTPKRGRTTNSEPAKKYRKVSSNTPSKSVDADWQKEIDELVTLRKEILTKSLQNQSQASVNK